MAPASLRRRFVEPAPDAHADESALDAGRSEWRRLGVGSALLEEIERKAAADGIEWLFGDTLRTNEGMIGLARGRGFRLEAGLEPRLVRIQKRLDAAPNLPCRKSNEFSDDRRGTRHHGC